MGVNDLETKLEYTYQNILRKYGFSEGADAQSVNGIVKESIQRFMSECNNPAIYCNGLHTRMLMTDFIFEMKKVKYIVDNYKEEQTEGGYCIIKDGTGRCRRRDHFHLCLSGASVRELIKKA